MVLAWREAKSVASGDKGRAHYQFVLIPKAEISPRGGSFEEGGADNRTYTIVPTVVSKWPWGETLVSGTDGCTEMQIAEGACEYVPRISAFKGDGETLVFSLGKSAVSTDKMKVYQYDGTTFADITAEAYLTLAVDSLTFTDGDEPASSEYIIVVMEVAA
jgi:hypothetical protein